MKDHTSIEERYQTFIASICATKMVYTLRNDQGFVTTSSINYENEEGQPVPMICFWSQEESAEACRAGAWEEFLPVAYPLHSFLEQLCVGLASQGILLGINFDEEMFGAGSRTRGIGERCDPCPAGAQGRITVGGV